MSLEYVPNFLRTLIAYSSISIVRSHFKMPSSITLVCLTDISILRVAEHEVCHCSIWLRCDVRCVVVSNTSLPQRVVERYCKSKSSSAQTNRRCSMSNCYRIGTYSDNRFFSSSSFEDDSYPQNIWSLDVIRIPSMPSFVLLSWWVLWSLIGAQYRPPTTAESLRQLPL